MILTDNEQDQVARRLLRHREIAAMILAAPEREQLVIRIGFGRYQLVIPTPVYRERLS